MSCKPRVKLADGSFQGDIYNNQPPPENDNFDASKYKGGPSPFEKYEYKDPVIVAENMGFTEPRRLNKSYDNHAEDCFGIKENRNKKTLEIFKGDIKNLARSADKVYKGSYRYETPAYIFSKTVGENTTVVVVNAINREYITAVNPSPFQLNNLKLYGNIGIDLALFGQPISIGTSNHFNLFGNHADFLDVESTFLILY